MNVEPAPIKQDSSPSFYESKSFIQSQLVYAFILGTIVL